MFLRAACVFFVIAFSLVLSGCDSGKTGTVTGVVKINGQPVSEAAVSFYPEEGRASIGMTDAEGKYELSYTRGAKGAV